MKKRISCYLISAFILSLYNCQQNNPAPAEGWTSGLNPYVKRYCYEPEHCAEVKIHLPVYRGDQSATLGAFNEKIQRHLLTLIHAPTNVPIEAALDSVTANFFKSFVDFKRYNKEGTGNWDLQLMASVPVLTPQITTVEARQLYFMLFDEKTELLHAITYDFRKEKYLTIADLIPDTTAFRPILEKAFADARELKSTDEISGLLLPDVYQLPLPRYAAVYPDGIRIIYNHSEYSHLQLPITDFKLSWNELDKLADRSKWLE